MAEGVSIAGVAFAPNSSARSAARLETRAPVEGEPGVIVNILGADDMVITSAPLAEITVDPRLGTAPRKLHFPDGALFETEDQDGIQALTGRTFGDGLHGWEAFHPRLIGVLGALVLSCFLLWRYGLDILVSAAIALTPPAVVDQIDRGTLKTIDFAMGAEETALKEAEQARIQKIFADLLAAMPADAVNAHEFTLQFRSMPRIGPNAFALPGGTVVMTDQFVDRFPQDDVLAGVLGHEVGHVVEEHGLRQMYRSLGLYILIGFLAGDTGPLLDELLLEGNLLLSLRFSREAEASADKFGVTLSDAAGYDPAGLSLFFEEMSKRSLGGTEWLSTHPSSGNRVQQIEGYIEALR
jgi:Zn-dependent protease with chaperone function